MTKKHIQAYALIAVSLFVVCLLLEFELINAASYAATLTASVGILYNYVLWRINPLEEMPRLRKKYISYQVSNYSGKTPMVVDITIKQTLSSIKIHERWNTGRCHSIAASLVKDGVSGEWKLVYTYLTDPPLTPPGQPLDDIHYGTAILNYENKDLLQGRYFTGRHAPTAGTMMFTSKPLTNWEETIINQQ